jgi:MYXO-CTERM domain-containing protein
MQGVIKSGVCLAAMLVVGMLAQDAQARSNRVDDVPNGSVLGCNTCHGNPFSMRNPFGVDVGATLSGNDADWSALFDLDSDGDGCTNGQELGDPDGTWMIGDPDPAYVSNPADASSFPEGGCDVVEPGCVEDTDCAEGEACVEGECVAQEPQPECLEDADCAEGQSCVDGACTDLPTEECVEDADCAEGEACVEGECLPSASPECVEDADCAEGEVCMEGACVDGAEAEEIAACNSACETLGMCPQFAEMCPAEIVPQLVPGCQEACQDPEARVQITQVSALPCETVVPLAIEGFGLEEVCTEGGDENNGGNNAGNNDTNNGGNNAGNNDTNNGGNNAGNNAGNNDTNNGGNNDTNNGEANNGDGGDTTTDDGGSDDGCAVTPGNTGGGTVGGLLMLLGLALWRRRRSA